MIYEGGTLKQILVDGGYVTFSGDAPQYHFYIQDHLGNNRVIANAGGTKEQVNHYYPFGGLFGQSTNGDVQRYKYNGKELDRMHGIDWYDYGARHMSPDAGRFTTMDPLAEKYYNISPYAYCANNPVRFIDKDGRKIVMSTNNSQDFNNQYQNAVRYLKEHECSDIIEYLENVETEIVIKEIGSEGQNYTNRRLGTNEIGWKAKEGLLTDTGQKISPAIRLFHEFVHQEHKLKDPEEFLKNTEKNNSIFHTKDDENIILNEETTAARNCGEIPMDVFSRESHGGIPYNTSNSTSRDILNPSNAVKFWQLTWEEDDDKD